ncbi:unnamed protein product [Prorocentrum cordatum]|uniref:Uncharacterized protein n=1 Tax=Prorocentrum cordatum TaxID=2364126 RepID=A0ABN9RVS2_9DINO|nr:unnamed protein product [Polarella glacialis]
MLAGINQGCPGSGTYFAASLELFLQLFCSIEQKFRGRARACADDLCSVVVSLDVLPKIKRIFGNAKALASLCLKLAKCQLLPLAGLIAPELIQQYRARLDELVPGRGQLSTVELFKYLGMWIGPD